MRHYSVDILGQPYTYRLLTKRELRELEEQAHDDSVLFEELVCTTCVISTPSDFPGYEDCLAYIPTTLCAAVMHGSGYMDEASELSLLSTVEQWAATSEARLYALMCFCFPTLDINSIEDMDPEDYHKQAMLARLIATGLYGVDVAKFMSGDKKSDRKPTKEELAQLQAQSLEMQKSHRGRTRPV